MRRWLNRREITLNNIGMDFRIHYKMCMGQKHPGKGSIPVTVL